MSDAALTVKMALDRLAMKQGLDGASADVDNFKKKFERSLRDTRGAVKDVSGSIEGIGRAFEGSVGGAVSGIRELIQLIPVAPWAAMSAAATGAFVAIVKHAERTEEAIAKTLENSIARWKAFRDDSKKIAEQNVQLEKEAQRPKEIGTEAVDFAMRERDAAKAEYDLSVKRNEENKKRISDIREARRLIDEYSKALGITKERAADILDPKRTTPTGMSVSAQRSQLEKRGHLYSPDIVRDALNNYNKIEESDAEHVLKVISSKNKLLNAEKDLSDVQYKYSRWRQRQIDEEADNRKQKQDKNQRELNQRVLSVMEEGHREEIEKINKHNKEKDKKEKREKKIFDSGEDKFKSMFELASDVNKEAADIFNKERTSIFDKGDIYQRMGGQVGRNLAPELRQADIRQQREKELVELQRKTADALQRIEKRFESVASSIEE